MSIVFADIDATCSSLGCQDGDKYYIEEANTIQSLKHLIWILRRDSDTHEYRRYVGHKKVIQTDLLPMLTHNSENPELADVLLRLMVNLTNPTLLLYREVLPKDGAGRRNYLDLIEILQTYKEAFTASSAWAAIGTRLTKVLEIDISVRSEENGLLLERILVLIRNVLHVPANPQNEKRADNDASLHDQVLWALHESGICDLVLYILGCEYENQYHLHALEIVFLIYREQKAEKLADSSLRRTATEKVEDEQALVAVRRKEKSIVQSKPAPARHSRFGGTYVYKNVKSISDNDLICHQALERAVSMDFNRDKIKQKRNFRHAKESQKEDRQSAFAVRLFLREFCIEILTSAYNNLCRQVRRVLERNAGAGNDDTYLLWAIRFFMEFNRLNDFKLYLISESLSVSCFHWIITRIQHDLDIIITDKRNRQLWNRRLQLGIQAYRELLYSMQVLEQQNNQDCKQLFKKMQNNVFYVLEYREIIMHLFLSFNESHNTKSMLRDTIDTANVYFKMMENFCKGKVVVQTKKRTVRRKKGKNPPKPVQKSKEELQEELEEQWNTIISSLSVVLGNTINIPEEEHPIPFDAASDKEIDDQKEDCMIRLHKMLRDEQFEKAVLLLRAAREVWPENECFGSLISAPEDELLLLREVFMTDLQYEKSKATSELLLDEENEQSDDMDEEEDEQTVEESNFDFADFEKRLLNNKVVRACTLVLTDWERMTYREIKSTVSMLHRIAVNCKFPTMLFNAQLFRVFQQIFHSPLDMRYEELRRLGVFVVRQFVKVAPSNPKIYAELLFPKSIRECYQIEHGYEDMYNEPGTKAKWSEEEEQELSRLFMENQQNPQTDEDVIDWILKNLINENRTRRGIVKKLKELGLIFKAPTKRSNVVAKSAGAWKTEEDELLKQLYDEHRAEPNLLQKMMEPFSATKQKMQVISRMVQLGLIANKSEILPTKKIGARNREDDNEGSSDSNDNDDYFNQKPSKPAQAPKRKIKKSTVDARAINRSLMEVESSFKEAVEWIIESLNEAAEDFEELSDDPNDGIPIVPIAQMQKDALESQQFIELLRALGMQDPLEMESYWRIPGNLNPEELKRRAGLLSGKIPIEDPVEAESDEDNSEDIFTTLRNQPTAQNLLYNDSDNENEPARASIVPKRKSRIQKRKVSQSESQVTSNDFTGLENNTQELKSRLAELNDSDESDNDDVVDKSAPVKNKRMVIDSSDDEKENEETNGNHSINGPVDETNGVEVNGDNESQEISSRKRDRSEEMSDVSVKKSQKMKRIRRVVSSDDDDD